MSMNRKIVLFVIALLFAPFLQANSVAELREDPEIKERFKAVASELRCLKCQNQTIYDSHAGLADDLKKQIRKQIYAGKSDEEIIAYMVTRYGDFVRFNPAVDQKNIFLWVGPFIFLIVGGFLLVRYVSARREETVEDSDSISDADRLKAKSILEKGGDK